MGINGLLLQLKSISRPTHVSSYRGQKVAIDGYSWLHKGAYCCSRELCEGIWTDGYIRYFISRIDMLLGNGVIPVVVFDGCRLPMKADEEESRRRARREAMERARAHAESGNLSAATECYQRAVNIAPWMAKVVMEALRERGVTCLVAPYEADAQMSYLALRGDVHAVLTEDSDMLAYGCPRVLYKLDRGGSGEEVLLSELPLVRELNMTGFDHDMLLQMCILAGCDFLPNLSGVGIKTAHALIRKHRDFVKVVRSLRFKGTTLPLGYEVRFQRTLWLFRHQRIFCPATRTLTHLRPLPLGGIGAEDVLVPAALPPEGLEREALPFLGPLMEPEVAAGIAAGDLDPSSLLPFDLPVIYRGCTYPPRHLRALLLPLAGSQAHGSQSQSASLSGGGEGSQKRLSWSSGVAAVEPVDRTHGANQSQLYNHHYNYNYMSQQSARGGRVGSKPPVPTIGRIDRYFFTPNPAASQPFRSHALVRTDLKRSGSKTTGTGLNATGGIGLGSGAIVYTLGGQPVDTVGALAMKVVATSGIDVPSQGAVDSGGGAGASGGLGVNEGDVLGTAGLDSTGSGQNQMRIEITGATGSGDGDGHQVRTCMVKNGSPRSSKRRRMVDGCPATTGGAPTSRVTTGSGSGCDTSLFACFSLTSAPSKRRWGGAAGHSPTAPSLHLQSKSQSRPEVPQGDEDRDSLFKDGTSKGLPPADGHKPFLATIPTPAAATNPNMPNSEVAVGVSEGGEGAPATRLAAYGSGPDSQLTVGPSTQQGYSRGWGSGVESDHLPSGTTHDGSQCDSQYGSQLTSGCEGAGAWLAWNSHSGGCGGGGGATGRSRTPARLALEALFMEPSYGGALPPSQRELSGGTGGGTGSGPGRQVLGPLVAFQSCRGRSAPPGALAVAQAVATGGSGVPTCTTGLSQEQAASDSVLLGRPTVHTRTDCCLSELNLDSRSKLDLDCRRGFSECYEPLSRGKQDARDTDALPGLGNEVRQQGAFGMAEASAPPHTAGSGLLCSLGNPQWPTPPLPPQFSIYGLDENEVDGVYDSFPRGIEQQQGSVSESLVGPTTSLAPPYDDVHPPCLSSPPAAGQLHLPGGTGAARRRATQAAASAAYDTEVGSDEEEAEAEVTSPLKSSMRPWRGASGGRCTLPRRCGVGMATAFLHPSARRRLDSADRGGKWQPVDDGAVAAITPSPEDTTVARGIAIEGESLVDTSKPGVQGGSGGVRVENRELRPGPDQTLLEELRAEVQAEVDMQAHGLLCRGGMSDSIDESLQRHAVSAPSLGVVIRDAADPLCNGYLDVKMDASVTTANGTGSNGDGGGGLGSFLAAAVAAGNGSNGSGCEEDNGGSDSDPNVANFTRALGRTDGRQEQLLQLHGRIRHRMPDPPNPVTQAVDGLVSSQVARPACDYSDRGSDHGGQGYQRDCDAGNDGLFYRNGGDLELSGGRDVCALWEGFHAAPAPHAARRSKAPGPGVAAMRIGVPKSESHDRSADAHRSALLQQGLDGHGQRFLHQRQLHELEKQPQRRQELRKCGKALAYLPGEDAGAGERIGNIDEASPGFYRRNDGHEDENAVRITADMMVGATDCDGSGGGDLHSVTHMAHFAAVARRTLDKLELRLLPSSPMLQDQHQRPALCPLRAPRAGLPHRRASVDGVVSESVIGGKKLGAGRPLAEFAFVRSTPRRRGSTSAVGIRTLGAGSSCRPSVFVPLTDLAADQEEMQQQQQPCFTAFPQGRAASQPVHTLAERDGAGLGRRAGVCEGEGGTHAEAHEHGVEGRGDGDGDCSDGGSDDVVFVREAVKRQEPEDRVGGSQLCGGSGTGLSMDGPGRDSRSLAEISLRRPFKPPRSHKGGPVAALPVVAAAGGAGTVRRAHSGSALHGRSIGARSLQIQPQQQQRITDFSRFAFTK